jgi:hypothetical protein
MRKFTWIVQTNAVPGQEGEFNAWYDDVHLDDLLRIPGVTAARRSQLCEAVQMTTTEDGSLKLTDAKGIDAKYKYLAIYELEADDPAALLQEIKKRSNTPEMVISPAMAEAYTILYENR